MYRVIAVGTDGSETAAAAVGHATRLAKLTGATLHIVNAYRTVSASSAAMASSFSAWSDDLDSVNAEISSTAEGICAQAASGALREGVKVEQHARPGDPSDVLLAVAEEVGADLLVVGNQGMTGVRRFVLGSVPNKVSHNCPCNLLIVDTGPSSRG